MDLFVDKDLDDDDSSASDADWNMGKNPEVDLKKLVSDIAIDNHEVEDLNNKDTLHLNDGLASDNTADDGVQHKQDDQHNFLVLLLKMNNNRTIILEVRSKLAKW